MSQRIMNIAAYDALDHVVIGMTLYELDGPDGSLEKRHSASAQVRGTGESSDRQWAVDALVALIETL